MHIVRGNNPLWWNTCHSPNPTLKESCNFRWWLQEELSILFERIASCLIHPEEEETGRCGPWRQHAQSARSMHTHMNSLWVKRTSGKLPKIKSLYCILPKHAVCQVKGAVWLLLHGCLGELLTILLPWCSLSQSAITLTWRLGDHMIYPQTGINLRVKGVLLISPPCSWVSTPFQISTRVHATSKSSF